MRSRARPPLDASLLIEVRAALEAGATPAAALGIAQVGALAGTARGLRLGRPLAELAAEVDSGDHRADLLVRGLAVAERTGAGATDAVEQVLRAGQDAEGLERALRVRTTQARGTALVLALLPIAVWLLLVVLDPRTLRFYGTPPGIASAAVVVLLTIASRVISGRIVAAVEQAPLRVDPLRGTPPPRDAVRAGVLAAPVAVVLGVGLSPLAGLVGGVLAGLVGLRRRGYRPPDLSGGGTPETAELLAVALGAGLPPVAAVAEVAVLGPPAARAPLADAGRRLAGGWPLAEAFAGTGLEPIGAALAATSRWGAPVAPALRRLAAGLRDERRAAGEAAAERTQIALLFPTTLLTLPAFVLGVVPPVLWTAFT